MPRPQHSSGREGAAMRSVVRDAGIDRAASVRRLLPMLCLLAAPIAQAGRPMATDDTSTAAAGQCQVEAWGDRVDGERSQVVAPACGLTDSLELDTAASRVQATGGTYANLVVGLKWVPTDAVWATTLGTVRLGLEGGVFWSRALGANWKADSLALVGLGSLAFAPDWNLYANLVTTRDLDSGRQVHGLRTALAWQPHDHLLLFVEGLRASDSGNLRNAGFRLWAIPGVLGLDVVATRSGTGGLSIGLGFGWYGLALPRPGRPDE
jgi:hypothetical protein